MSKPNKFAVCIGLILLLEGFLGFGRDFLSIENFNQLGDNDKLYLKTSPTDTSFDFDIAFYLLGTVFIVIGFRKVLFKRKLKK